MFSGNNVNAFTPKGRILQLQYACEAANQGATSIGIYTPEVVILAAEKRPVSPLMVAGGLDKIVKLDTHLYCTVSGLQADARSLIDPARLACLNHWLEYQEFKPIEPLLDSMAQQAINFGLGEEDDANNTSSSSNDSNESSSSDSNEESDDDNRRLLTKSRPYGSAFLLGGVDNDQVQLWHLEPNGEFGQPGIKAIGSGSHAAEDWMLRNYQPNMDRDGAIGLALGTMQVIVGEQRLTPAHLELMVISKGPMRCHQLNFKELELEIVRRQGLEEWH